MLQIDRRNLMKGAAWAVPAITVAAASPAMAASAEVQPRYMFRSNLFAEQACVNGSPTRFRLTNGEDIGSTPHGFAFVNQPASNGEMSEPTMVTIARVQFTFAIPEDAVDANRKANPFSGSWGGWKLAKAERKTLTSPDRRTRPHLVYTFVWNGAASGMTVPNSSPRPQSWTNSIFDLSIAPSTNFCSSGTNYFHGNFTVDASTQNGVDTTNGLTVQPTLINKWVNIEMGTYRVPA